MTAARLISAAVVLGVLSGCGPQTSADATAAAPQPAGAASTPAPTLVAQDRRSAPAAAAAVQTITPEGLGPVRIGMTESELLAALGPPWRTAEPHDDEPGSCRHVTRSKNEGPYWPVSYMLEGGRVSRIEVGLPSGEFAGQVQPGGREVGLAIRTERGLGLGATEAEVRAAYGAAVQTTEHTYDDAPASYLDVWTRGAPSTAGEAASADARGLRFVTDRERRVVEINAGGPAIQYVEGCL